MTIAAQVKAEAVLALHLALRHRAVRLTGLLLVVALGLARDQGGGLSGLVLLGGVLAATAAARPLAPGPAFHTARRAAANAVVTVLGRLAGVTLLLLVATLLATLMGGARNPASIGHVVMAMTAILAIAAPVLALAPLIGASGAAGMGILATLFGQLSPTALSVMLERWPLVRDGAVLLWNVTPLGWRADRWEAQGGWADASLFVLWIGLGVAAATWALLPPRDIEGGAQ
jgi:hypothetical protein